MGLTESNWSVSKLGNCLYGDTIVNFILLDRVLAGTLLARTAFSHNGKRLTG